MGMTFESKVIYMLFERVSDLFMLIKTFMLYNMSDH